MRTSCISTCRRLLIVFIKNLTKYSMTCALSPYVRLAYFWLLQRKVFLQKTIKTSLQNKPIRAAVTIIKKIKTAIFSQYWMLIHALNDFSYPNKVTVLMLFLNWNIRIIRVNSSSLFHFFCVVQHQKMVLLLPKKVWYWFVWGSFIANPNLSSRNTLFSFFRKNKNP